MKADAWHYELVGSQMGMVVMEHLTPRMVITHSSAFCLSTAESQRARGWGGEGVAVGGCRVRRNKKKTQRWNNRNKSAGLLIK